MTVPLDHIIRTMIIPDAARLDRFRCAIYSHYEMHGRDFPWRHTIEPYHITVAEVMLQQTQTSRVVARYQEFIDRFPTFHALARARIEDVLDAWQGMGYNRRAIALHSIARQVCDRFNGTLPQDRDTLRALPGIGPYTASAIRAFAFNLPEVFVETNIRAVFLHEFFPEASGVPDKAILPLVDATMDRTNPRRWYQALMDYGAMLKVSGNPSRRSAHHRTQSRFQGSRRQARGIILRFLLKSGPTSVSQMASSIPNWSELFADALQSLQGDRMVSISGNTVSITTSGSDG